MIKWINKWIYFNFVKPKIEELGTHWLKKGSLRKYSGIPLFNRKCHENTAYEIDNGNCVAVTKVLLIYDDCTVSHFLCMDHKGNHYDPTMNLNDIPSDIRVICTYSALEYGKYNCQSKLIEQKQQCLKQVPLWCRWLYSRASF